MNHGSINRVLFSLFLLEDQPELLEDLVWLVPRKLPGTAVRSAETIEAAFRILDAGYKPTVAVLDARVPAKRGLQPKADPRIADRLHDMGVASLCMTGHVDSEDVIEYLNCRKLTSPPLAVIEKTLGPEYVDQLFGEIRTYFTKCASQNIRKAIVRVFEGGGDEGLARSGTAAIMSLQQDIIAYWPYLDDAARSQVRQWFAVELDGQDHITRLEL
jgi:hypothetical protein